MIDAERVHHLVSRFLKIIEGIPGGASLLRQLYSYKNVTLSRELMGLKFGNPVGLAAGFDKDAKMIDELACLGFGFIEVGTLTPRPQAGNEKPRLFRLPKDKALINRMGFNNDGVIAAVARLKKRQPGVIVGGNIGKNKDTPIEKADDDYTYCFEALYDHVDYFVINVSSPNTPGLRQLQEKEPLRRLLDNVKRLRAGKKKEKPIVLKIAPDLTVQQLDDVIDIVQATRIDGVIATNTSISRKGLVTGKNEIDRIGNGGLSGNPLSDRSNEIIRYLRRSLGPQFPIIGVGGIMSTEQALEKLKAGANLIQIYTGFIYEGPGFVKKINKVIAAAT